MRRPRLAVTLGDVAGIGPEIVIRAWPKLVKMADVVVFGDVGWMRKTAAELAPSLLVELGSEPTDASSSPRVTPVIQATQQDLTEVRTGKMSAAAGRAAYDFLCQAIEAALRGEIDAIVTAPLHKEGLRAAGLNYPGHTEILASKTGATHHAMLLWGRGLTVGHVTLHMSLREALNQITTGAILETSRLVHQMVRRLKNGESGRLAVAAVNPHASDGGMFGNEEQLIIAPAVEAARGEGLPVVGPIPADTLFARADRVEFDGIVAMYHDQGHIPMKLRCGWDLVNITAGLPIIRTSVAHGTAYDIAGRGVADPASMIAAADVACRLVWSSQEEGNQ